MSKAKKIAIVVDTSGNLSGINLSGTNTGDQTTVSGNAGTVTTVTATNLVGAVAPSTSGNVLTSNGTTWTSAAPTGGTAYVRTSNTATAGQTTFNATYTGSLIEVFLNGVLLNAADYTASDGTTVVLASAALVNDLVETIAYGTTLVGVATAAGAAGKVQFNNNGVLDGASFVNIVGGHLNCTDSGTIPTKPAVGTLTYFAEDHAGRMLPSVIGPSGVDLNLQSALFNSNIIMWIPSGTTTTVSIGWGVVWAPRNTTGAQSSPTKSSSTPLTSLSRALFSSTAAINTGSGTQSASTTSWLGNADGLGGFLFFARFGVETLTATTGKILVGLAALNSTLATATEPSANAGTIALCKDSTDTTWQIVTRGASAITKTNTLLPITVGQILDLYIHSAPNSQSVKFHIKDGATGADLYISAAITTNLPPNNVFFYIHAQIMNTTAAVAALALNRLYLESDL